MSGRAGQLRAKYLEIMLSNAHADNLIVLWRRWRHEVTQ